MIFKWDPLLYDKNSDIQHYISINTLKELAPFSGDECILDIGCAGGRLSRILAKKVPRGYVKAIDKDNAMIVYAQKKKHPDNLEFLVLNAKDIQYQKLFDIVISFWCFHWIPKIQQENVFKKIVASLKTNGILAAIVALEHKELYDAVDTVTKKELWAKYFDNFNNPHIFLSQNFFQALLLKIGLTIREIRTEIINCKFIGNRSAINFLQGWLPHVQTLPHNLQIKFVEDVIKQLNSNKNSHFSNIELRMLKFYAVKLENLNNIITKEFPYPLSL